MFKQVIAASALVIAMISGAHAEQYDKPGFVTKVEDGRLWIFKDGSPELADMQKNGFPEKAAIRIGEGPDGMTIKAANDETLQEYLDTKAATVKP